MCQMQDIHDKQIDKICKYMKIDRKNVEVIKPPVVEPHVDSHVVLENKKKSIQFPKKGE